MSEKNTVKIVLSYNDDTKRTYSLPIDEDQIAGLKERLQAYNPTVDGGMNVWVSDTGEFVREEFEAYLYSTSETVLDIFGEG